MLKSLKIVREEHQKHNWTFSPLTRWLPTKVWDASAGVSLVLHGVLLRQLPEQSVRIQECDVSHLHAHHITHTSALLIMPHAQHCQHRDNFWPPALPARLIVNAGVSPHPT